MSKQLLACVAIVAGDRLAHTSIVTRDAVAGEIGIAVGSAVRAQLDRR